MKDPDRRSRGAQTTASRNGKREPRLPHERDESSAPGAPVNDDTKAVGKQAAADLKRGLVDTDIGPVLGRLDAQHFATPARRRRAAR